MNKLLIIVLLVVLNNVFAYSQKKSEITLIKHSVIGFLRWYKNEKPQNSGEKYPILKSDTIGSTGTGNLRIDFQGVEKFVGRIVLSKLVSNAYSNELRGYFVQIDNQLELQKPFPSDAIIKVDGLDLDIVLQSFEPELVLDYVDNGIFKKIRIVGNKAVVLFFIPDYSTSMTFILTKLEGVWLLDHIDYIQ